MIFGAICVALSLISFAWAGQIAHLGSSNTNQGQSTRNGLIIALVSFWIVRNSFSNIEVDN